MKQFNIVVFGGLAVIFLGIILMKGFSIIFAKVNLSLAFDSLKEIPSKGGVLVSNVLDSTKDIFSPKKVEIKTDEESIDTSKEDEIKNITDIASDKDVGSMQNKKITAISYMVMNLDKAKTILNKNESRSYPIASLTKLVTAVVSRRLNDKDKKIEINEKMLSAYGNDAHFRKGETYSASDLLYPLLLVSSNDASEALAQSYGRTKFIRAMNDFVQEIGAYNTYFVDPSGISPQNISNAHDLAIIVEWIYRHDPQILDITSNKSYSLRGHVWINPSHYLNNSKYIGGKNGYTPEAKLTTVAIMKLGKENQAYAIVLLGGKDRDGDIRELMQLVDTK